LSRCSAKYIARPPAIAIALMSSGRLKPCQTARWYSGGDACSTAVAATCTSGPKVAAGSTPTTRHTSTSRATGSFMNSGGSWGCGRGTSFGSPWKNTSWMKRTEYATEQMPAKVASAGTTQSPGPAARSASSKNISFDRKPLTSGTPAIEAAATIASVAVHGMWRISPASLRMSRVPVSWSMMPAVMNSEALKVAWFRTWNTAATLASGESRPTRNTISPRWLIVEYASSPFRSCRNTAT
jgi:hypothetical protein